MQHLRSCAMIALLIMSMLLASCGGGGSGGGDDGSTNKSSRDDSGGSDTNPQPEPEELQTLTAEQAWDVLRDEVAFAIDQEMRSIIDGCHERVKGILRENLDLLNKVTKSLLEREILEGEDLETLISGGELPALPQMANSTEVGETSDVSECAESRPTGTPQEV